MLGIDTSVLFYSLNPASGWHKAATAFLKNSFQDTSQRVVLSDVVLTELYVLLRNPSVMARPLSAAAARNLVTSYFQIGNVMRIENGKVMDDVWALAGAKAFSRRRIFDARLALTLRRSGVTHFATVKVKDFQKFGFEKVWNPLEGADLVSKK